MIRIFQNCILCELTMAIIYRSLLSFDRFDNDRLTHAMTRVLVWGETRRVAVEQKRSSFCALSNYFNLE